MVTGEWIGRIVLHKGVFCGVEQFLIPSFVHVALGCLLSCMVAIVRVYISARGGGCVPCLHQQGCDDSIS